MSERAKLWKVSLLRLLCRVEVQDEKCCRAFVNNSVMDKSSIICHVVCRGHSVAFLISKSPDNILVFGVTLNEERHSIKSSL
jgi:hypothetical protein